MAAFVRYIKRYQRVVTDLLKMGVYKMTGSQRIHTGCLLMLCYATVVIRHKVACGRHSVFLLSVFNSLCNQFIVAACPMGNSSWCRCSYGSITCDPNNAGILPKFQEDKFLYDSLHLTHQNLNGLESKSFFEIRVRKLVLDYNPLRRPLSVTVFHGRDLEKYLEDISICNTGMYQLHYGLFLGLQSLRYLYICKNEISFLPESTFQGADNLEELYLWGNQIEYLEEGIFIGLSNLRKLDLEQNQIRSIPMNTFRRLHNLEALYLGDNYIQSIERYSFQDNTKLKVLKLQNNGMQYLRSEAFLGLTNLRSLHLNHNNIGILWDRVFNHLVNLNALYLQNNKIKHLMVKVLRKTRHLRELNLSYNGIMNVPSGTFRRLQSLEILYLEGNDIRVLHRETFHPKGRLYAVYLTGNPLRCNCYLAWLHEMLQRGLKVWGTCLDAHGAPLKSVYQTLLELGPLCGRRHHAEN